MKVAIVSPYSWSYPGGVVRHIHGLYETLTSQGHQVTVLAPYDPDDRLARFSHGGRRPQQIEPPPYLVPLGRTLSLPMNGAQSNICFSPHAVRILWQELRTGKYDLIHVHEPIAPLVSYLSVVFSKAPVVSTYHAYSTNPLSHTVANLLGARWMMHKQAARIAVSPAAAWTAQTFFGGHYDVIPNGIKVLPALPKMEGSSPKTRILFIGQPIPRKGLPVLLQAFGELRERAKVELTLIGASQEDLQCSLDTTGVTALGKVSDERKYEELARADILCIPSISGESFGIVLAEGLTAGLPVVASDIPGYRDVVHDHQNGRLVPPGDPQALAGVLLELVGDPVQRNQLGRHAKISAAQYGWPTVASQVLRVYRRVLAERTTLRPPAKPRLIRSQHGQVDLHKIVNVFVPLITLILIAFAFEHFHLVRAVHRIKEANLPLMLAALAIMIASMAVRAASWFIVLRQTLSERVPFRPTYNAIAVGVFISATSPLRLGEVARAIVIARHTKHPVQNLPRIAGTILSQTLMNILALIILGSSLLVITSVHFHFSALKKAVLVAASIVFLAILGVVIAVRQKRLVVLQQATSRFVSGFRVFRSPMPAVAATAIQLGAWLLQAFSCYILLYALHIHTVHNTYAAAATLFAVNVTAVVPITPSNVGTFQAACIAILSGVFGVNAGLALAYGILLQFIEVLTAILIGTLSLHNEGMSRQTLILESRNTKM